MTEKVPTVYDYPVQVFYTLCMTEKRKQIITKDLTSQDLEFIFHKHTHFGIGALMSIVIQNHMKQPGP